MHGRRIGPLPGRAAPEPPPAALPVARVAALIARGPLRQEQEFIQTLTRLLQQQPEEAVA